MDAKGEEEEEKGKQKEGKMLCHHQPQPTIDKLIKLNLAKRKPKGGGREGKEERREDTLPLSTSTNLDKLKPNLYDLVITLLCL